MRIRALTVLGLLATAGPVVTAGAQERGAARAGVARLEADLGLSAEQAAQMRSLRAEARKQAIRHRADLAIARLELEELMDAATVDEKAVGAKVKAISDLEAAALKSRTDERLAIRRLLTPEQQQKLKQLAPRGGRGERGWPGRASRGRPWGRGRPAAAPTSSEPER
jgi:Spy/CpxP family protein refolding chaperone